MRKESGSFFGLFSRVVWETLKLESLVSFLDFETEHL